MPNLAKGNKPDAPNVLLELSFVLLFVLKCGLGSRLTGNTVSFPCWSLSGPFKTPVLNNILISF